MRWPGPCAPLLPVALKEHVSQGSEGRGERKRAEEAKKRDKVTLQTETGRGRARARRGGMLGV